LGRIEKNAFYATGVVEITLPVLGEILDECCFYDCRSLSFIRFESGSRLSRVKEWAFSGTGLIEIILPSSIEVLDERCFSEYRLFP
jgi:hypothetical protein